LFNGFDSPARAGFSLAFICIFTAAVLIYGHKEKKNETVTASKQLEQFLRKRAL